MAKNQNRPMSLTVQLYVTLDDPAQWTKAFGVEGRTEIRDDVKTYVAGLARSGVFTTGEVSANIELK